MPQKTFVYRNLHKKCYSVRKAGLVIARGQWVWVNALPDKDVFGAHLPCTAGFKVNQAGRERVLRERQKNIHAFAWGYGVTTEHDFPTGYLEDYLGQVQKELVRVTYNPYVAKYFYRDGDTKSPVGYASEILLTPGGVWVRNPAC